MVEFEQEAVRLRPIIFNGKFNRLIKYYQPEIQMELDMGIKISIIVSVYNDEKHIERCIKSVLNQIYDNYELNIIDDGSTDKTPFILKEYRDKDKNINLYTLPNQGLGEARNYVLRHVTGDYILFLDSDDELLPNCLSEICNEIEKNKTDIIMFSSKIIFSDGIIVDKNIVNYYKRPDLVHNNIFTAEDFYNISIRSVMQFGYGYPVVVWAYAYNRQKNIDMRFLQKIHEDEYFTTALFLSNPTQRVKYINKKLHSHYIRKGAITTSPTQILSVTSCIDAINSLLALADTLTNNDTIKNIYINTRLILSSCIIKNRSLHAQAIHPLKIIERLIKPILDKKIKETGLIYQNLLRILIQDIVKIYELHNDHHAEMTLSMIYKMLDK